MQGNRTDPLSTDLSFQEFVGVLRRQRLLVAGALLSCLALAAGFSLLQRPAFRSVSTVLVEDAPRMGVVDAADPMMAMQTQDTTYSVPTQVEVLQSNQILEDALTQLGIDIPKTQDEFAKLPRINVDEVADTNVIEISVDAETPELARKLAATLPFVYYQYIQAKQRFTVKQGLDFVADRVGQEKAALLAAAQRLSDFKKAERVVDSPAELSSRIELSNQAQLERTSALAGLKAAEGQYEAAVRARRSIPEMLDVPSSETNATAIEQAKMQLAQLEQQRKQLLVDYREDSAPVRKIADSIKVQQDYIVSLSKDVKTHVKTRNPDIPSYDQRVAQAKGDLDAARARLAAAEREASAKGGTLRALTPISQQQQEYERQVAEHQNNLQRLAETGEELRLQDNSLKQPVSNISGESKPGVLDLSGASLPLQVAPRWLLNMVIGGVLGIMFGCFMGLARDALQNRVNTERDVRWASELDILARLPIVPGRVGALIWDGGDQFSLDRFRLLRSNLVLAAESKEVGIVPADESEPNGNGNVHFKPSLLLPYSSPMLTSLLVTSTFQGEGKSMVAANLATAIAMDDRRVILVDANLRVPSVHKSFGLEAVPGLTEVLYGKASLEGALQGTSVDGLRVLTCGELPLNPSGLLASQEMLDLHEQLKSMADVVIYDCVSSYALADAQALAAIVGSVVFVTQRGVPRKDDMREAVSSLMLTKAKVLGVVLNKERSARVVIS